MHNREFAHRFKTRDNLARSHELDVVLRGEARQGLDELEDAALSWLQLAQGLIIHEEIDELLLLRELSNPADVLVGCERILGPVVVVESERDVVAHLGVLKQKFQFGRRSCGIDVVGRLPSQYVLGPVGDSAFEPH